MALLEGIKEKAKNLINMAEPYATRQTKIYNATKNRIIVAGITLDGVVSFNVSSDTILAQQNGIHYTYVTAYEVHTERTLTVSLLPTADCLNLLRLLAMKQVNTKGWFNISVHENGSIDNVYRGWILSLPELGGDKEGENRQVVFAIKPVHSGMNVIDQPTQVEVGTNENF